MTFPDCDVEKLQHFCGRLRHTALIAAAVCICLGCTIDDRNPRVATDVGYQFQQGMLRATNLPTDLALEGIGFVAVELGGDRSYVRGGRFFLDDKCGLKDIDGRHLQGTNFEGDKSTPSYARLEDFWMCGPIPPKPTSLVEIVANLDAATIGLTVAFDVLNPSSTSNFGTSVTAYDSRSKEHQFDVFFRRLSPIGQMDIYRWEWHAVTDGGGLSVQKPGTPVEGASGQLLFGPNGTLMTATGTESLWNFAEATPGQMISWRFGDATSDGGTGVKGVTQFSSSSAAFAVRQDGQGTGFPFAARVTALGVLDVDFSTGQSLTIGTIPIIVFEHFSGLAKSGIDAWLASEFSGPPLPGQPGLGGRAALLPGFLEDPVAR